jgi:hypothetical protein
MPIRLYHALQRLSSGGRIDFWAGLGYTECTLGRVPDVEGLDLERAGVEYHARGTRTNEYLHERRPSAGSEGV